MNQWDLNNQDPHSQIENDEIPGAEYTNDNDSEDIETNKTSTISTFMPQMLPGDEIIESLSSLNSKQREVFNVVHKWCEYLLWLNGRMMIMIKCLFRFGS